jgi:soluble cytochrome b562
LATRRTRLGAALAGALVLLLGAACGGGGGGGDDSAGTADLAAQAQQVGALLDQVEALPTSATTTADFQAKLGPLRDQIQTLMDQINETSVPDELNSQKDQLGNRLRSLRTQLGRVDGLLLADNLDGAKTATEQLLSIQQLRITIAAIEEAAAGGT